VIALRLCTLALCFGLVGCGRRHVEGVYHDAGNPAIRYELRDGGRWFAELIVEVPSGVFPHGASRRLEGTFKRKGGIIELVCLTASRQDPISGAFRPDDSAAAEYSHFLAVEDAFLVPVGPDGKSEAFFAAELNPLGARQLVPEESEP